jgi:hypothetical protein
MPCCAVALRSRFENGMVVAWQGRGMAFVNQKRPHYINKMGKTKSKPLAARHGIGTAWCVWLCLKSSSFVLSSVIWTAESRYTTDVGWLWMGKRFRVILCDARAILLHNFLDNQVTLMQNISDVMTTWRPKFADGYEHWALIFSASESSLFCIAGAVTEIAWRKRGFVGDLLFCWVCSHNHECGCTREYCWIPSV